MRRTKFPLPSPDQELRALSVRASHRILAIWARDCARRVLPYFERACPADPRPRRALDTLQDWIDTGNFQMKVIRQASLDSHAAARQLEEDSPARSAARAAGQAVASAHVPAHALAAASYALQARYRAASSRQAEAAVARERGWQYRRLAQLVGEVEGETSGIAPE